VRDFLHADYQPRLCQQLCKVVMTLWYCLWCGKQQSDKK